MKKEENEKSDIEECKYKIQCLLREYNCELIDGDEGSHVLLYDKDTQKTIGVNT